MRDYNPLQDAHDIAVNENTPGVGTLLFVSFTLLVIIWGFGMAMGMW